MGGDHVSATAEEIEAADGGAEPSADPGEREELTREDLIEAIASKLREDPNAQAELLAEIYLEASAHRQMLEEIAGTLQELLADPKRIVKAFFGGRRGRREKMLDRAYDAGEQIAEEELAAEELDDRASELVNRPTEEG